MLVCQVVTLWPIFLWPSLRTWAKTIVSIILMQHQLFLLGPVKSMVWVTLGKNQISRRQSGEIWTQLQPTLPGSWDPWREFVWQVEVRGVKLKRDWGILSSHKGKEGLSIWNVKGRSGPNYSQNQRAGFFGSQWRALLPLPARFLS